MTEANDKYVGYDIENPIKQFGINHITIARKPEYYQSSRTEYLNYMRQNMIYLFIVIGLLFLMIVNIIELCVNEHTKSQKAEYIVYIVNLAVDIFMLYLNRKKYETDNICQVVYIYMFCILRVASLVYALKHRFEYKSYFSTNDFYVNTYQITVVWILVTSSIIFIPFILLFILVWLGKIIKHCLTIHSIRIETDY